MQEEERSKQEKIESAHLAGTSKDKGKKRKKDKEAAEVDSCHSRVIRNQQNLYPIFLLLP